MLRHGFSILGISLMLCFEFEDRKENGRRADSAELREQNHCKVIVCPDIQGFKAMVFQAIKTHSNHKS